MKRFIALLLALAAVLTVSACETPDKGEVNIIMPDDAPAYSMSRLITEGDSYAGFKFNYSIVKGPNPVVAAITNGDADIALMPTNLAANLYNGGLGIKLVSVNVSGAMYMVGTSPLENGFSDLVGEVLYSTGKGGTPDITFKYMLTESGIDFAESDESVSGKVAIKYDSSAESIIAQFLLGNISYAIISEPAVTRALEEVDGLSIVADMQQKWGEITGIASYPQVSMVVRADRADEIGPVLRYFVRQNERAAEWLKENGESARDALVSLGSGLSGVFPAQTVDRCNIGAVSAADARQAIEDYLGILMDFNPNLIGGKLPDDGFYYAA